MTLLMMIDVISAAVHSLNNSTADFEARSPEFRGHEDDVFAVLRQRILEKDVRSWLAIVKRLWRMHKSGVFGTDPRDLINVSEMFEPGRLSIVDLSDTGAPYLRNSVIAQMLRLLLDQQDEHYRLFEAAQRAGAATRPPLPGQYLHRGSPRICSAERIKQMANLFDQVERIARRGRKRYLALVFVTQLPSHLPDEVFGLIHNWILHKRSPTPM